MATKLQRLICRKKFFLGLVLGFCLYLFIPRKPNSTTKELDDSIARKDPVFQPSWTYTVAKAKPKHLSTVRIVCMVLTDPARNYTRTALIKLTWGKRCNKLIFMSTHKDSDLRIVALNVTESPWNSRKKSREAWRYIYHNHINEGDWFLAVEDVSFVIMENLKEFLVEYDPFYPLGFGHLMKSEELPFLSKRPGYVLSQNAVRILIINGIEEKGNKECNSNSWSYDDIAMGNCFASVGIRQMDTRDSMGRLKFLPLPLATLLSLYNRNRINACRYWSSYSYRNFSQGIDCCSDRPIIFYELNGKGVYTLEYMAYHLRAYGIRTIGNSTILKVHKKSDFRFSTLR